MVWNKTSEEKISLILEDLHSLEIHVKDIAKKHGVSRWLIGQIQTNRLDKDVSKARISYWCAYHKFGDKNPMFNVKRELHPTYTTPNKIVVGYNTVEAPSWWKGSLTDGFRAYEHHIVCCEALGLTSMPSGHVVHHIDHNKLNNSIENLQMMTRSKHMSYHAKEYWKVQRLERKLVEDSVLEAPEAQHAGL